MRENKPAQDYFFLIGSRIYKNKSIQQALARIAKDELNVDNEMLNLPTEQHNEYRWFSIKESLESKQVHKYVKGYFRGVKHDK